MSEVCTLRAPTGTSVHMCVYVVYVCVCVYAPPQSLLQSPQVPHPPLAALRLLEPPL